MWYASIKNNRCNTVDRIFYDAIKPVLDKEALAMIDLDFLKKCAVFKTLSDTQLEAIQKECCQEKWFEPKGEQIFAERQEISCLHLVMEGRVDLRFDLPGVETSVKNNLASAEKRHAFGWSGLIPPHKSKLSAYCASDLCKIVMVDRECLTGLFQKDPDLGCRVMTNMAMIVGGRFKSLQELIAVNKGYDIMFSW
jgi:CRP-like cAMP-binding protein